MRGEVAADEGVEAWVGRLDGPAAADEDVDACGTWRDAVDAFESEDSGGVTRESVEDVEAEEGLLMRSLTELTDRLLFERAELGVSPRPRDGRPLPEVGPGCLGTEVSILRPASGMFQGRKLSDDAGDTEMCVSR